jgi:hypothetical protein
VEECSLRYAALLPAAPRCSAQRCCGERQSLNVRYMRTDPGQLCCTTPPNHHKPSAAPCIGKTEQQKSLVALSVACELMLRVWDAVLPCSHSGTTALLATCWALVRELWNSASSAGGEVHWEVAEGLWQRGHQQRRLQACWWRLAQNSVLSCCKLQVAVSSQQLHHGT